MGFVNWTTLLIMYMETNTSTNYTTNCTYNVSYFLQYVGTFVVVCGLIGNFLSILVFSRKALRTRSCSVYFLALSMSDVHVLIGYTIENLLYHGYGIQLLSNSFMCKSTIFLIYASTDISNYLLSLAAIDRCVLISNSPYHFRFCRQSTAKFLIGFVVILFSLINSHFLYGFRIDQTGSCLPSTNLYIAFYIHHYDSYIDIIKTVLIPFTIIFFCNTFIIIKYTRQRNSFNMNSKNGLTRRKSRRRKEKDRQLTWFLLSTSILFILLSLPSEINDFIRTRLSNTFQINYTCELWALTTLLILIQQTNHASHFYVYTLTGPIFRKEFQKLICFWSESMQKKDSLQNSRRPSCINNFTQHYDIDDRRFSIAIPTKIGVNPRTSFKLDV